MDSEQLRELITDVLQDINLFSEEAVELLMLTACVESNCGEYIRQVKGPARGVFQMEPNTEKDIWDNYLKYKPVLASRIRMYKDFTDNNLHHNLAYQVAMARVHYLRVPRPIPIDVPGLASYWKDHYNTYLGAGTVEKAIEKYERYGG